MSDWITARVDGSTNVMQTGRRLVIRLAPGETVLNLLLGHDLKVERQIAGDLYIVEAAGALLGLFEAESLSLNPMVLVCRPVFRRNLRSREAYVPMPNDPLFSQQWYLENRDANGTIQGADLNIRAAWAITRGEGTLIAVGDGGIDLSHPDLKNAAAGQPHFNFALGQASGSPYGLEANHGTSVAGLAVAEANNGIGVVGAAPAAKLASWVVLGGFSLSDEELMDMYQYQSETVTVQNHSWGYTANEQIGLSLLERIGISNAVHQGRSGRGVILVRAGGNEKGNGQDVNDEEEASDPSFIAVAAVRSDGRVATYSERGACLLIAAPGGDDAGSVTNLVTTDRSGVDGFDTRSGEDGNYYSAFTGTSAAAPQISGLAALLISANPALTVRDVQQILILSARHFDLADPDLATNGAGFRVSHNLGFGVPDAGEAVRLALHWINRPEPVRKSYAVTEAKSIPERSLLTIGGTNVSSQWSDPPALPSLGPVLAEPGLVLPLVDIGLAKEGVTIDLHGKAALIQRGGIFFREKLDRAAQLGASFAIVYNNVGLTDLIVMGLTEFTSIPAVFIGQADGEAIQTALATQNLTAQLVYNADTEAAAYTFDVPDTLICEHAGVRLVTNHPRRGDLQITLITPSGTRSLLQKRNLDTSPGPADWTYYSTHSFFEGTAGLWRVLILDQRTGSTGAVQRAELLLSGVSIRDSDRDGLDDDWELRHFGHLQTGPKDDSDEDGYSNIREQLMGTDPRAAEGPLTVDISRLNRTVARLSWAGQNNRAFQLWSSPTSVGPFSLATNIFGRFPVTEWLVAPDRISNQFFQLRTLPSP